MSSEKKITKIIDSFLKTYFKKEKQNKEVDSLSREIEKRLKEFEKSANTQGKAVHTVQNYHIGPDRQVDNHPDKVHLSPGQVWVKDNEIYVKGLPGQNILPCIEPSKGVSLFVNGNLVKNKTAVTEHDYIQIDFQNRETPFELTINTSKDGLTAYMSIRLQTETKYTLVDQPPKPSLVLLTTTNTKKYCPLNFNDILEIIKEERIQFGVDYQVIQQFLADPRDGRFIIARGIPPTDSRDDVVDVLFPEEVLRHQYSDEDRIDFFNLQSIPSVDAGSLLAVKKEGEMGQPGLSVTGEIILPREPRKITIQAGKGTRVEENMVYSNNSGRPMVKRIGSLWLFYMEPYLRHYGNIDLSIGDQNFRGNIEVYGDVCDGITVRAGGNASIMGSVNHAKVIAMESVLASKCIGALVQAGGDSHFINNCSITIKELRVNLEGLSNVLKLLLDNPEIKKFQNQLSLIILILIEKKFTKIPKLLKETVDFLGITPVDIPAEIESLVEMIKKYVPPRNLTPKKLKTLLDYVDMAQNYFAQLGDTPADVHVGYAYNSVIAATRDVRIAEQGCFNSKITAGGNVFIGGVIRGGEVKAKGNITVNEAGSEVGTKTILKTENQKIKILKKIYEGVIIGIRGRQREITKTMGPVEFYNDDDENIKVVDI